MNNRHFKIVSINYDPKTLSHTVQLRLVEPKHGEDPYNTMSGNDFMKAISHTGLRYEELHTRMLFQTDNFANLIHASCLGEPDLG